MHVSSLPCVLNVLPMSHLDLKSTSYEVPLFSDTLNLCFFVSLEMTYKVYNYEVFKGRKINLNDTCMETHCCLGDT
jgi:hypothetical protein